MGKTNKRSRRCGLIARAAVASALLLEVPIAGADPTARVHLSTVVQGEIEFKLLGGY
jgi:hypothetical protein